MKLKIYKKIKQQDKYGHKLNLQINQKGNQTNTFIGGLLSISNRVLFWYLFFSHIVTMVHYEHDKINQSESLINYNELGVVKMDFTRMGN